ncbi:hypothetical protein [Burkholderia pseudomallei]|uniref:hypothetical protein n=1 Tax=Burkholderia pseudomallei TaxID=28450 RepID=UPI000F08624E|nr:hypothetical protein [Burkholderia pseudomallei]
MTDDDWRLLEKILPDLPPLRYPMSEEERAVFMAAYCAHPSRPAWMPDLVTDVIISRRKAEQAKFIADQHRTMQHEIWTGRLALVNAYHTPVATPMVGAFIPRAQAVAYMERFGIPYLELAGKKVINELIVAQTEPKSSLANEDWRPGERKLSPETQRELVKFHNELKEADQKRGTGKRIPFVKLTAERFGLSRRHVSNIVAAAGGAATKEERIDHLLVGKPQ